MSDMGRKRSVPDLPVLGAGRTAFVYDMGGGKVLKLFEASIQPETVRQEFVLTQLAHENGIPAPGAYEIVQYGGRYGIVMDRVCGRELETVIREQPGERHELLSRFTDFVKKLHQVTIADERMPDVRDESISLAEQLDPSFCTKEEAKKICAVFESIPPADSFVHGDCHPGNVMIAEGNLQCIDMTLCGKGHPVFDLLCMYSHYVFLPSFSTDAACISRFGMDKSEARAFYESFLKAYFTMDEEADLSDIKEQIQRIHAARICLSTIVMPGAFPDEVLRQAKNRAAGSVV